MVTLSQISASGEAKNFAMDRVKILFLPQNKLARSAAVIRLFQEPGAALQAEKIAIVYEDSLVIMEVHLKASPKCLYVYSEFDLQKVNVGPLVRSTTDEFPRVYLDFSNVFFTGSYEILNTSSSLTQFVQCLKHRPKAPRIVEQELC